MIFVRLALLLVAALLLSSCGKEPLYQEEGFVFGTRVEVSIYGEDEAHARQAVTSIMQEFQRLHELLHAWKPSALSKLNAAFAAGQSASITPELATMLQEAAQLSAQSDGLFNPAIGGLVKLWGFHADEYKPALPDSKQLAHLVAAQPLMSDINFNLISNTKLASYKTYARNRSVQLDLGGYAKGYALDRAVVLLKRQGIQHALINIGGNVLALGTHGSRPWRVGIQHPRKPGPLATLALHDGEAIGTSGDYQRYFELDGQRYCHVINPRTGLPVQGVQAVTVLTRGAGAGVLSDATSKPIFIAGAEALQDSADKMQVKEALLIDAAGVVHLTTAMQKRLEFTDSNTVSKLTQ
jgi:thiamine biosynthesis lipoprotein